MSNQMLLYQFQLALLLFVNLNTKKCCYVFFQLKHKVVFQIINHVVSFGLISCKEEAIMNINQTNHVQMDEDEVGFHGALSKSSFFDILQQAKGAYFSPYNLLFDFNMKSLSVMSC